MLAAVVLSFLLASASAGDFILVAEDDPSIQLVKNVILGANFYLEDHLLTELKLPNIGGMWPTDVVTLTDGKIGEFNTLALQGNPEIQKRTNPDGSTTYLFDIKLALQKLAINYHYKMKIIGFVVRDGTIDLVPEQNTLFAKGIVVVRKDGQCDAEFYGVSVDKFDGFKVVLQPNDIPGLSFISETILNYVTPKVIPVTNMALRGAVLSPLSQNVFSQFVCNEYNRSIVAPPTRQPNQPTDVTTERTYPTTERNYHTTERTYPSSEGTFSTTERSYHTTERTYPSSEGTFSTTERNYHTTERTYPSSEGTFSTTERNYHTTERTYPSSEGTFSTTERNYHTTERTYPSSEGTFSTTERNYHTTERPYPSSEGTFSTTERNYHTTERPYPSSEGTFSTTERNYHTTERPYPSSEGTFSTTERNYHTTERTYPSSEGTFSTTERNYPTTA